MEDTGAEKGRLPLRPMPEREGEAAASIDYAGDQYHLAGTRVPHATTLLFGNNYAPPQVNYPPPQGNQSHGDHRNQRGTGEPGNNGQIPNTIPILKNTAINEDSSVIYGPYGLENARNATDQYPLNGPLGYGYGPFFAHHPKSQEEQNVSYRTEANDTANDATFLTSTTEDESYENYEQQEANDSSVLPVTTDEVSLLPSTAEGRKIPNLEQRDASHDIDANAYADYILDRIPAGPSEDDLSAENLPPILHRLEKPKKEKRPGLETVNVDGQIQLRPTRKALKIMPSLPRHISYHVDGWILEYLRREDETISAIDIISRMNQNEAKFSHAREVREAAKHKAKQENSKKEPAVAKELADWEVPDLTKPENVGKIGNIFNMKRNRDCREPLNLLSWEKRRPFPTKRDCIRIDKLSEDQIKHNTTLKVTEQGLQRVRLVGGSGGKRAEPIEGSYLPLDFYLENSQKHVPGAHIAKALEFLKELKQKAETKKLSHWTKLDADDWPEPWRKQTRSLESTPAKKRKAKEVTKAEDGVTNDAETGSINRQKISKAKSGPAKKVKRNEDSKSTAVMPTGPQQTQNRPHLASYVGYPPPANHGHGMAYGNITYQGQVGQALSQTGRYVPHAGQVGRPLPPVAAGRITPGHFQATMTNTPPAAAPGRITSGYLLGPMTNIQGPMTNTPPAAAPGRITPGYIQGPMTNIQGLMTNTLPVAAPGRITAGRITAGRITAGRITAGRITPGRITPGRITPGRITPGRITPGRITPGRVTLGHFQGPTTNTPTAAAPGHITPGYLQGPMANPPPAAAPGNSHRSLTSSASTTSLQGMYAAARADPARVSHTFPAFAPGPVNRNDLRQTHGLDMSFINDPTRCPGDDVEAFYRGEVRAASRERLGINATPAEIRADMWEEIEVRTANPGTAQWLRLLLQQIKDDLAE